MFAAHRPEEGGAASALLTHERLAHLDQARLGPVDAVQTLSYLPRVLFCEECLLLVDDEARGWRLIRADLPEEDDEPMLAAYCPDCAEREFGLSRRIDSGQAGA